MNDITYDLADLRRDPVSRRRFLQRMSAAGLGLAAASLLAGSNSGCGSSNSSGTTPLFDNSDFPGVVGRNADDVVFNYALTLEILEADLYRQALNAASGRALSTPLDPGSGPTGNSTGAYSLRISTGGLSSSAAGVGFLYLAQYAYVEAAHRDFLRSVLQSLGAPITAPNRFGYQLPAGSTATLQSLLQTIYAVEETGVRAYLGAAPFMTFSTPTDKSNLETAVAIQSTEARHSAAIAEVLGLDPGPIYALPGVVTGKRVTDGVPAPYSGTDLSQNTFGYYSDPSAVLAAVKPFIVGG